MFGYVNINKDTIDDGQRGLWQSFMCQLCFSTKTQFGNLPRAFISNDVNFFNVLFHSVTQTDVQINQCRCASHPVKKRSVIQPDEMSDKLAVANVLLTYYKLYDDVLDGSGVKKRAAYRMFGKYRTAACARWNEMDAMLAQRYGELRALEQANCGNIDQVCHPFAQLSGQFAQLVLGERATTPVTDLCYNLGKWIYLADALEDLPKDLKRRNYNPFVASFGITKARQLAQHISEVQFEMYAVLNRIAMCYNDLDLTKYTCLLNNVLFESIRNKTAQVLKQYKIDKTAATAHNDAQRG